MRLFSPRKTTLLFVIRDKSKVCNSCSFLDNAPLCSIPLSYNVFRCFWMSMQTPMENLEPILREDIQKVIFPFNFLAFPICLVSSLFSSLFDIVCILQIWDAVSKPQAHKNTPLSEFFNVRRSIHLPFSHTSLTVYLYTPVFDYSLFK